MTAKDAKCRDLASERQVQAARPDRSTWLSANAGSGKTRVLTDRVTRLLLDGVQPQHILCLTYTKAAATEMQNRLFQRLGAWAMMPDAALRADLGALGHQGRLEADTLGNARTLFARAIETPGGLKIQTIHSFCAFLLRRFPLEAGVSPQFVEMEERAAELLRGEVVEQMASDEDRPALDAVALHLTDQDLGRLTAEIVSNRAMFAQPRDRADLADRLGVDPDLTLDEIAAEIPADAGDLIDALIPVLRGGSKTDVGNAEKLAALPRPLGSADLPALEAMFLYGEKAKAPFGAKIGAFPTKPTQAKFAEMDALDALMQRVEVARPARVGLLALDRAEALHRFAAAFLHRYARRKLERAALDFDDLIEKARDLVTDSALAQWVLFRLDGGIDHILVDEAQDTSPAQWEVIERLAQEFTAGQGARPDVERTIFVVGDKKQSIYSFQGARPEAFDAMQAEFGRRLEQVGSPLQSLELEHSFRSSKAILGLVDAVFSPPRDAGLGQSPHHIAFREQMPGRVDLWPLVEGEKNEDDRPWYDPVDRRPPDNPNVILAHRIAGQIEAMLHPETGETLTDTARDGTQTRRRVQAGDILILVQRRSTLFQEIIRACKARNLPIAGADRLKVGAELAVKDLGALMSFLALPEDDLSLAHALRSPLFGWTEQMLYSLAQGRGAKFLWQELRDRASEFPETMEVLADLRQQSEYLRPYDLIARVLTLHDGRRKLLGRLGAEAEDGIDALLSQALAYERNAVPTLTGFIGWMQTDDLSIKRQMDSAGNRIRVMTVHASKGLEAPIVILPDTAKVQNQFKGALLDVNGTPMWKGRAGEMPPPMRDAVDAALARQAAERMRLLYVAMTRAESWLIVAAAGDLGKDEDNWYSLVESGMQRSGARGHAWDFGEGLRLVHGDWHAADLTAETAHSESSIGLPDWTARTRAPRPDPTPSPLNPSDLGGPKALGGDLGQDSKAAMLYGSAVHRLLELLPDIPPQARAGAVPRLLPDLPKDIHAAAYAEANAVLSVPSLAHVFAPDTLAEVALTATLPAPDGRRIAGVIDRLIVTDSDVTVVDFKTNRTLPRTPADVPDGLLRQMGAYLVALRQIWPHLTPRVAILWTADASLMELPHDLVSDAVSRLGLP